MCWLPQCAPRRRAADESGVGAATRACVVAQPSVQPLRARRSSDEQSALCRRAAVLVSRRTALRAAHCAPAERRATTAEGPIDASVLQALAQPGIETELVSKRQP